MFFKRKKHFWNVCFSTSSGAKSVIVSYPDKLMTAARLMVAASGEGLDTDCTILAVSYLGKMSIDTARTRI